MSMSVIDSGLVTIVSASSNVVGSGTTWLDSVGEGDILSIGGALGFVDAVLSDTEIRLLEPWPDDVALGAYSIIPYGVRQDFIETNRLFRELSERVAKGQSFKPDASGSLAGRSAFDDEPQNFFYAQTDVEPFLVFAKLSAASADWSGGVAWLAKGDTGVGDQGPPGPTPVISIGSVTNAGTSGPPDVTISGPASNPVLNFNLQQGEAGPIAINSLDEFPGDIDYDDDFLVFHDASGNAQFKITPVNLGITQVTSSNIVLNVYATQNDVPVNDTTGFVGADGIQEAIDYSRRFFCIGFATITINVKAGDYTLNSDIIVRHPQPNVLKLIGEGGIDLSAVDLSNYSATDYAANSAQIVVEGQQVRLIMNNRRMRVLTGNFIHTIDGFHFDCVGPHAYTYGLYIDGGKVGLIYRCAFHEAYYGFRASGGTGSVDLMRYCLFIRSGFDISDGFSMKAVNGCKFLYRNITTVSAIIARGSRLRLSGSNTEVVSGGYAITAGDRSFVYLSQVAVTSEVGGINASDQSYFYTIQSSIYAGTGYPIVAQNGCEVGLNTLTVHTAGTAPSTNARTLRLYGGCHGSGLASGGDPIYSPARNVIGNQNSLWG